MTSADIKQVIELVDKSCSGTTDPDIAYKALIAIAVYETAYHAARISELLEAKAYQL